MMSAIKPKRHQYVYVQPALRPDGVTASPSPGSINLLSGVALNGSAASRTIVVQLGAPAVTSSQKMVGGMATVCFGVAFTYGAATAITATFEGSFDGGVTYYKVQAHSVSAGVDTLSDYSITKATGSANQNFSFVVPNDNYSHMRVVFSGTGANGSDLITVQAAAGCQ